MEVSRCRAELKQALENKDFGGKSKSPNKDSQSSSSRHPMTSRIMALLEKDAVKGGVEDDKDQLKKERSI